MPSLALLSRDDDPLVPNQKFTFGTWLPDFFVAAQLAGIVGMSFILVAVLFLKVQRHPTFVSFIVSWFISAWTYSLLLIGGQHHNPTPSYGLCLTQASLAYGAPSLTALTTTALVLQLWFNLHCMSPSNDRKSQHGPWLRYSLLVVPYIVYAILIIVSVASGASNPQDVTRARSGVYCIILGPMGKISVAIVLLSTVFTIGFEAFISVAFYRNWKMHRNTGASVGMLVRVLAFSFWSILAVGASLVFVTHIFSPLPNVFIALMPVMAFVIFGTQSDILRAFKFWDRSAEKNGLARLSSGSTLPMKA